MKKFLARFAFDPQMNGLIGIEREFFLANRNGTIVPESPAFLNAVDDPLWTYELSACQVEHRTIPLKDDGAIKRDLLRGTNNGVHAAQTLNLSLLAIEVAAENMPLTVYPEPRYRKMAKSVGVERLRAACRVAGIHIHYGVSNIYHAIRVYNALITQLDRLITIGDHSNGLRLELYKTMAPDWKPVKIKNPEDFFLLAQRGGFIENPRNSHQLIRISPHGTVECRMFGMTPYVDEILRYGDIVKQIARRA